MVQYNYGIKYCVAIEKNYIDPWKYGMITKICCNMSPSVQVSVYTPVHSHIHITYWETGRCTLISALETTIDSRRIYKSHNGDNHRLWKQWLCLYKNIFQIAADFLVKWYTSKIILMKMILRCNTYFFAGSRANLMSSLHFSFNKSRSQTTVIYWDGHNAQVSTHKVDHSSGGFSCSGSTGSLWVGGLFTVTLGY